MQTCYICDIFLAAFIFLLDKHFLVDALHLLVVSRVVLVRSNLIRLTLSSSVSLLEWTTIFSSMEFETYTVLDVFGIKVGIDELYVIGAPFYAVNGVVGGA